MKKIISLLAILYSNFANSTEIPWYFDDPNIAQKSSINANQLVLGTINKPVVVAVIDSGVNSDHPSLKGKVLPGFDMVSPDINPRGKRSSNYFPDPKDAKCPSTNQANGSKSNHGTEVASIITGNGELGINGINPSTMILPVRAVGPCSANYKDLIDSIIWSVGLPVEGIPDNPTPAKVLNISIAGGNTNCSDTLQNAINKASAKGAIIISSAGNTFGKAAQEPAVCKGVISVGSVNPDKSLTFYSPHDARIQLYTPGGGKNVNDEKGIINRIKVATFHEDILGNLEAIGTYTGIGTSYSSPMVAGVIADILSGKNTISPEELLTEINKQLPLDSQYGYRILNYEKLKQTYN